MSTADEIRALGELEAALVAEARRLERINAAWTGTTPGRASGLYAAASITAARRLRLIHKPVPS